MEPVDYLPVVLSRSRTRTSSPVLMCSGGALMGDEGASRSSHQPSRRIISPGSGGRGQRRRTRLNHQRRARRRQRKRLATLRGSRLPQPPVAGTQSPGGPPPPPRSPRCWRSPSKLPRTWSRRGSAQELFSAGNRERGGSGLTLDPNWNASIAWYTLNPKIINPKP